ncbi:hypothetical protein D3C87_192380 [compost metagenome]
MKSLYILSPLLAVTLLSCTSSAQQLNEIAATDLKEISGLEYLPQSKSLWALEDSGNENKLYKIGNDGKSEAEITITNTVNTDWEELTSDAEGNLYIGDFGNNDNARKDLVIYKIDKSRLTGRSVEASSKITFSYPEQTEFPSKKSTRIYDCEAFFEHKGNFYLFTKNRSAKFDGSFSVYKVPNRAGDHKAVLMGSLKTCGIYKKCAVTAADISPDGTKAVLLTGDKVFVITNFGNDNFASGDMQMLELGHASQKEGLCFKDNDTLLIADEKDKKTGGKLYEVKLSALKAKL